MNPRFPIYIVSKGRWETRLTSKALDKMGVPYFIVVEQSDYDNYVGEVGAEKVLILPQKYLDEYDCFDGLGDTKSKGPGSARNFAWEHSISQGHEYHWVMDDNLRSFQRLNRNFKAKVADGTILRCAEDFVYRYENIGISGLNYETFCYSNKRNTPFLLNTRIYSCLLIKNNIPFRWRGRYNEDTDLSLRILKAGLVTCQFNAFLCEKITTQKMGGGNTEEFYGKEGTKPKSQMLADMHPDVATIKWKFNRWHHYVDYKPFINNMLIMKKGLNVSKEINEYGMILKSVNNE